MELTHHQAAALNIKNSISLSANAGSGKTFVLAIRYIQIALNSGVSLSRIAAITFTEKAAGELYRKISNEVDNLIAESSDDILKSKLYSIRRQLVSANISTIHSFCIDILKEFPVEAGLDASFTPIDIRISQELLDISIEEVISLSNKNSEISVIIRDLIRLFFSESRLRNELKYLFDKRKNLELLKVNLYSKDVKTISEFFRNTFISQMHLVLKNEKMKFIPKIFMLNQEILSEDNNNHLASEASDIINRIENEAEVFTQLTLINQLRIKICTTSGTIRKKGYLCYLDDKKFSRIISECEMFLNDFSVFENIEIKNDSELILAEYGMKIMKLYDEVYNRYSQKKSAFGFLDFEDILLKTKLLLESGTVQVMLSDKFSFLMVDEYQDTNDIQYQIFLPLLDYLKKGNLFIVGDAKQSIYKFIDADISVFEQTSREIGKKSGEEFILNLPDSFRMSPAICLFVNKLFENLFAEPDEIYNEVKHSDLICAREESIPGKIEVLIHTKSENDYSEGDLVSKRILSLINEGKNNSVKSWGNIAVLVRKRSAFPELEKSFVKYNIPYSIIGGRGFYQRQPVYDIFNYISFLLDPGNDTALTGILRSPFFNIADSKIFSLSISGTGNLWTKLKRNAGADPVLKLISNRLEENIQLASSLDIPGLLRLLLQESEFLSVISSSNNGAQEIANIEKLINITTDFYNNGFNTLYDYVEFLKSSIEGIENEAQAGPADTENCVNLMTIHQAKGLEFPAVFLFKCNETSFESIIKSKTLAADKNYGILTKVPDKGNYFGDYISPPINILYNFVEEKKNLAEIKRLFYVAATRACDYLFITAEVNPDKDPPPKSFLYLLKKGLGIDLAVNQFILRGELGFLKKNDNEFENLKRNVECSIPILKFNDITDVKPAVQKNINTDNEILINTIPDHSKNEIISATKFSVFSQCPLKYKLTYHNGFSKLMEEQTKWEKQFRNNKVYEFNESERFKLLREEEYSSESLNAGLKGKIIHKVLQVNPNTDNLSGTIRKILSGYSERMQENISDIPASEIIAEEIKHYIDSDEYKYINSFKNFYNEYEIYFREKDYFLFGIIDKLIFEKDKILIIDYKTDNISKSEIPARAKYYNNQLSFYAYILAGLNQYNTQIVGRLEFIKHPGEQVVFIYNQENIIETGSRIKNFINHLRDNKFNPNFDHCKNCGFYLNSNNCVAIQ